MKDPEPSPQCECGSGDHFHYGGCTQASHAGRWAVQKDGIITALRLCESCVRAYANTPGVTMLRANVAAVCHCGFDLIGHPWDYNAMNGGPCPRTPTPIVAKPVTVCGVFKQLTYPTNVMDVALLLLAVDKEFTKVFNVPLLEG